MKKYEVYADGSYIDGRIGYGAVILSEGEIIQELSGSITDPAMKAHRQVGGEIEAVRQTVLWLKKKGISDVSIYYDYEGIAAWPTGKWKANKELTKSYAAEIRASGITIRWIKVKSHSGNKWNDVADTLAKKGAFSGSTKKEEKKKAPVSRKDDGSGNMVALTEKIACEFADRLQGAGFSAVPTGVVNNMFSRIEIFDGPSRAGVIDIYNKKAEGIKPDFRGFRDQEIKEKTALLWAGFLGDAVKK